jgi:hypothetical protein
MAMLWCTCSLKSNGTFTGWKISGLRATSSSGYYKQSSFLAQDIKHIFQHFINFFIGVEINKAAGLIAALFFS